MGKIFLLIMWVGIVFTKPAYSRSFEEWIIFQKEKSTRDLLANISPFDGKKGSVIASTTRSNPDYYFHWVRDAALTMAIVVSLYERSNNQPEKEKYFQILLDYIHFSRLNQLSINPSGGPHSKGLGEPKFHVDGTSFWGKWGRPQNDGPALRAITLIQFAKILIKENKTELVKSLLYDGKIPTESVIKADLEFVSHHWREPSFDLWEEVNGQHFYTRMAQRRALVEGASLALLLNDPDAADWYLNQSRQLEARILEHWDENRGYIQATLLPITVFQKNTNLDSAVVLASLHTESSDSFFSPSDERILATANQLRIVFSSLYPINNVTKDEYHQELEPAIGRYPEDRYNGYHSSGEGNPWFILTAAFAELHYRISENWKKVGFIKITKNNLGFIQHALRSDSIQLKVGETILRTDQRFLVILKNIIETGDRFLKRFKYHASREGNLSEQMNRNNGYMQGAENLTWSCASFLSASQQMSLKK